MPVTYNLAHIGMEETMKMSAFGGYEVEISNTYSELPNAVYKSITVFLTKKLAIEFCERWGFQKSLIRKVKSRFQKGWAIGLGRDLYAPDLAEGMLFAKHTGCIVKSINDERMWINSQ